MMQFLGPDSMSVLVCTSSLTIKFGVVQIIRPANLPALLFFVPGHAIIVVYTLRKPRKARLLID